MTQPPLLAVMRLCTKSRRNISDSHSPICNPQQRYAITVSDKPKESLRILPIFVQYRGLRVADLGLRTETRFRLRSPPSPLMFRQTTASDPCIIIFAESPS